MDWERKFSSIIRDTEANLSRMKVRKKTEVQPASIFRFTPFLAGENPKYQAAIQHVCTRSFLSFSLYALTPEGMSDGYSSIPRAEGC